MGWTNADLQKAIDQFGERICYISLNNGKGLFIGYNTGTLLSDITLTNIGSVDLIKIHHKHNQNGKIVEWDTHLTTEFIESVDVMTEECADNRIDPFILKA